MIFAFLYDPAMDNWKVSIESELRRMLPEKLDAEWVSWIADEPILETGDDIYDISFDAARSFVLDGGKRWRPQLMLLVAKMLGGEKALRAAQQLVSVVELSHNGSLIIDDIEDGSTVRRGKPAVHITFGEDLSINGGNFLYYLCTKAIDEAPVTERVKLLVYQIYAKYMRRLHLGQGMDIVWHRRKEIIPTVQQYEQMCIFKTGSLAAMSAQIGAAVAVDDRNILSQVGVIAEQLGVGFQIQDDVMNLETGNPGKQQGDDIMEQKKSLPIILYVTEFPQQKEALFSLFQLTREQGYEQSRLAITNFIEKMKQTGTLEKAKRRAHLLGAQAIEQSKSLFAPSQEREQLISLIQSCTMR